MHNRYKQKKTGGAYPKDDMINKQIRRALLADDEVALRELYSNILQIMGFEVTKCKDGLEALKAFSRSPERFHLVFTDYMMPYIDGIQLSKLIRKINKEIPIILCSGCANNIDTKLLTDKIINVLLSKPLQLAEFQTSIKQLMR